MQPFAIMGGILREPVVEGAKTRLLEFDILQREQRHPQRRVQHLGGDPVNFLVLDPLGRVPAAGTRGFVALAQLLLQFLAALAQSPTGGDREGADTPNDKGVAGPGRMFDYLGARSLNGGRAAWSTGRPATAHGNPLIRQWKP